MSWKLVAKHRNHIHCALAEGFKPRPNGASSLGEANCVLDALREALARGNDALAWEFAEELTSNPVWLIQFVRRYAEYGLWFAE